MNDTVAAASPPIEVPAELAVSDLYRESLHELGERANSLHLRYNPERTRRQLILDLLRAYGGRGTALRHEGVLELAPGGHGFLRSTFDNFRPGPEDPYVSSAEVKRFSLQNGNLVSGRLRLPRDREKYLAVDEVIAIEGREAGEWVAPKGFDDLTPMFPDQRILLENDRINSLSARAIDLIAPLGRGQRGLIVAAPRTGKTVLLKEIARSVRANSPDIRLILLLIDERPEEVTDFRRTIDADIYCSTFDENPARHVQLAELVSDRAKRLVEIGADVLILLDSITRLARGYNALQPAKGRTMSGGVESKALLKPKKFFGSARRVEEGGSLTILATALVETESRMDELIFEEFKGTGNMELHLDRGLVEQRIFPAIHVTMSGTRREELLYHPDEFERIGLLRKELAQLPPEEGMEHLLRNLQATKTNAELLLAGLRQ
jgi:transcription termination factor Rho